MKSPIINADGTKLINKITSPPINKITSPPINKITSSLIRSLDMKADKNLNNNPSIIFAVNRNLKLKALAIYEIVCINTNTRSNLKEFPAGTKSQNKSSNRLEPLMKTVNFKVVNLINIYVLIIYLITVIATLIKQWGAQRGVILLLR